MPALTTIAVINQSTSVSNEQVEIMTQALTIQLAQHFCPAWGLLPITVSFCPNVASIPCGAATIYIVENDAQVQGALGYHQEESNDVIDGYIMCQPILTNGGTILNFDASNPSQYSVSGTLSHEVMETIGDVFTNTFCVGPQISQGNLYCQEMCDPVEQIGYSIQVGGVNVSVSDFILPAWTNPYDTKGPFNYLRSLPGSFQMLSGGYMIVATFSAEGQATAESGSFQAKPIFGADMPQWRQDQKNGAFTRATKLTK